MAKEKIIKTNAIRILEKAKVPYVHRCWEQATGQHTGVELAQALGQNPEQVFKTLVTVAKSGEHYVFLVPVAEELDLKKPQLRWEKRPFPCANPRICCR